MRVVRHVMLGLLVGYAAITALMYAVQRQLVFSPSNLQTTPAAAGWPRAREVVLRDQQGMRLVSWYAASEGSAPTVLYAHGNGGALGTRVEKLKTLAAEGWGVFAVGYPGYSGNEGAPTEAGWIEAATLGYCYLVAQGVRVNQMVGYGQSLGSSVVVQIAAKLPFAAVVLEAPMSSAREIAADRYPFLPIKWLLRDPFLSIDVVASIKAPLLVIHGSDDAVIPLNSGVGLFNAARGPKELHVVQGGGHNNLYRFDIDRTVRSFVERRLAEPFAGERSHTTCNEAGQ